MTPAEQLQLAERAATAAGEDRIDDARRMFGEIVAADPTPTDLRVLFLLFQFHFRRQELDEAERWVRRRLDLTGPESDNEQTARAYTNLALIFFFRKDLDAAEATFTKALNISRRIGHEEGIARDMGNLALAPEARGDLDRAEALYREALAIAERIGAEPIIATKLANLGDIAVLRGRPSEARELWTRALEIVARQGNKKSRDEFTRKVAELPMPPD
jgi:tetratricopeptide (TPR) repeat protein